MALWEIARRMFVHLTFNTSQFQFSIILDLKKMQNNKACDPDGVPTESLRLVDKIDPMLICDQMNDALEKGIPTVWRTTILTPLYKRKGNVTDCNNYRGIEAV